MIQITAGALVSAKDLLSKLANTSMPAKDCLKVLRILKRIDTEYNDIMDTQKKTLEKYAKIDDEGNFITNQQGGVMLKEECQEECVKEMNELYSSKIVIEAEKLPVDLLESLEFTPSQLLLLENLIDYGD